jgi:glycosyltransferase involved in cell wall biosynthesis
MRTVVASSYMPTLDSGRARRTYALIRALAANGPVSLVYGAFGGSDVDPAYDRIEGLELRRVERPGRFERLPVYGRARLAGVPDDFARGIWPRLAAVAATIADGDEPSRLVAEGPVAASAMLPLTRRRPVVYSAHNLESSFRHRLDRDRIPKRALERFERLLLGRCEESWMVSPVDIAGAAALCPRARLRLVPNVVDVGAIRPVSVPTGRRDVVFVADLTYEPNAQALNFLVDGVMPTLWERDPEARLLVAGKESDRIGAGDPRVEGRGFVPDLAAFYGEAGCAVVPLLEGGGSPLKFVEALAYGLPIVATPTAAAGLELEAGRDYLEAEPSPVPFAEAILAAFDPHGAARLGAAARAVAEERYSIESLVPKVAP